MPDDQQLDVDRRQPTVDVVAHLRHLASALPAAVLCAAVIAVIAGLALAKPVRYESSVVAQVVSTSPIQVSSDVTGAAAIVGPFVQLSHDSNVMRRIAVDAGVGSTPSQLASDITVAPDQTAGLLTVSATASDPATAQRVAASAVKSMNDAYQQTHSIVEQPENAVRQAQSDLEAAIGGGRPATGDAATNFILTKLDNLKSAIASSGSSGVTKTYLVLLSSPTGGVTKTGGVPWTVTVVVFFVALIVSAEAVVLVAGRGSRKVNAVWAHRIARRVGGALRFGSADGRRLPLETEMQVTESARHGVVLALDPDFAKLPDELNVDRYGLDGQWWEDHAFSDVALAILVVEEGQPQTAQASAAADRLSDAGIPTQVVVIRDGTYFSGWHVHLRRPSAAAEVSADERTLSV